MEETRLRYLYQRFNERTASDAEVEAFHQALSDPAAEQLIKSIIEDTWEGMSTWNTSEVSEHKAKEIYSLITAEIPAVPKTQKLWPRIVAVAAMAAMVVFGLWLYSPSAGLNRHAGEGRYQDTDALAPKNDITPGSVGATLTLANGKKIRLTDALNGELAQEAGVKITKTAEGLLIYEIAASPSSGGNDLSSRGTAKDSGTTGRIMTNTLSTAKGETYQVRLPDGSLVYLNAASALSYPSSFADATERRVKLSGEGYFEVSKIMIKDKGTSSKEKRMPFIVESLGQQVEVLGTHFNINSYADEDNVKTTLLEGSVKVSSWRGSAGIPDRARHDDSNKGSVSASILKPGQQAIVAHGQTRVVESDTKMETAWINGKFVFNSTSFESAMNMISRWYNVEIVYNYKPATLNLGGSISRSRSLADVLKRIEQTDEVKFKIEGRRVSVIK